VRVAEAVGSHISEGGLPHLERQYLCVDEWKCVIAEAQFKVIAINDAQLHGITLGQQRFRMIH
jgi:hypothetical protein